MMALARFMAVAWKLWPGAKLEERLTKSEKNSLFANAQKMAQTGPNRNMGSCLNDRTLIVGDIDPSAVTPREGPRTHFSQLTTTYHSSRN